MKNIQCKIVFIVSSRQLLAVCSKLCIRKTEFVKSERGKAVLLFQ